MAETQQSAKDVGWGRTYKKESRRRRKGWWMVNMARKGFRRLEA